MNNPQEEYAYECNELIMKLWFAVSNLAQFVELNDDLRPIVRNLQMTINDDLMSLL